MIGELDPKHKRVDVIGAGISGLLLAYRLDKLGYEVHLTERAKRVGGLIQTHRTPFGLCDAAASSFLASAPVRRLCHELGVELTEVRLDSRTRYVWRNKQMRRFPLKLSEVFGVLSRIVLARSQPTSQTMSQWARKHLGPAAERYLLGPFLTGVFGARPSEVSLATAFPKLIVPPGKTLLGTLRGRKRERKRMMTPRLGMEELPRSLGVYLKSRLGKRFRLDQPVTHLPDSPNIALCVPADDAGQLLEPDMPAVAQALRRIRYVPMVCVNVGLKHPTPKGVGVLVPEGELPRCLGVLFSSASFPGRAANNKSMMTFMYGGTRDPDAIERGDEAIAQDVSNDLSIMFSIDEAPSLRINRYKRALPLYDLRLEEALRTIRGELESRPGCLLFGNYTGQISIRGMVDDVSAKF